MGNNSKKININYFEFLVLSLPQAFVLVADFHQSLQTLENTSTSFASLKLALVELYG
jgi:hypothetical protein